MVTTNTTQINNEQVSTIRPPIVVVLGHVDHGKSSLLEAIREDFKITSKEAGGITQHIGAYMADYQGNKITFLDTPGHELFSAMRSRGAKVADIAVLVVAADESVKPQTIEAIQQIKKAGLPMVVAINKIDRPGASPEKVKQELAQHEVMVESYGGSIPSVETSATAKQGITELLEMILLMAELERLEVSTEKPGSGTIIEAHMDAKRGPTATILVENGTVQPGNFIATASAYGKIRILEGSQGQTMNHAVPSTPAVILGFLQAPRIGEEFQIFNTETAAQAFTAEHATKTPQRSSGQTPPEKTIPVILKADVAGSLEALQEALFSIPQEQTGIHILEASVGEVRENDVKLARSSGAAILSFRVKTSTEARSLAEKEEINIESFDVIYKVIERARELLEQSIEQEGGRQEIGTLNVLAVFLVDKNRQVIGGKVTEGEIKKGLRAEIIRSEEIVGQGKATNVQHNKQDVPSVQKGQECGLSFEAAERIQEGDTLQFFIEKPPQ